jgi:ABC-type multidrug transport system fused ATPase/permease subunit
MFKNLKLIKIFLTKKEVISSFFVVFLLFIGTILEMVGLGAIPLYLLAIFDLKLFFKNIVNYYPNFINYENFFNINFSKFNIALFGSLFLIIFFILKNIFLFTVSYFQAKMICHIQSRNSLNLYKQYINSEYLFYINKNPSVMIRNISIIEDVILYLAHLINVSREVLLIFFSFFILFFINMKVTLIIFFFFIFSLFLILFLTRNNTQKFSTIINNFRSKEIKMLTQSIEGIKDLKVFQQEKFFELKFSYITAQIYLNKFFLTITHTAPKLILEVLSVLFIITLLLFFINYSASFELALISLSAYAIVIIRMLPSFASIASNGIQLRAIGPSVQILHKEFFSNNYLSRKYFIDEKKIFFKSFDKLEIRNLNFFYKKNFPIIENFSLTVHKGETIGIMGSSGKGKSTLVNLILGLIKPVEGIIKINGISVIDKKIDKNLFGFVPQNIYLLDDTIKRNIAFGISDSKIDDMRIKKAMKVAQIDDFVFNMSEGVNSVVGNKGITLSGGQIQRIGIARAIYHNPKILILDESTSSLDINTENEFLDILQKLKKNITMIIISHKKSTLRFCNKIIHI